MIDLVPAGVFWRTREALKGALSRGVFRYRSLHLGNLLQDILVGHNNPHRDGCLLVCFSQVDFFRRRSCGTQKPEGSSFFSGITGSQSDGEQKLLLHVGQQQSALTRKQLQKVFVPHEKTLIHQLNKQSAD